VNDDAGFTGSWHAIAGQMSSMRGIPHRRRRKVRNVGVFLSLAVFSILFVMPQGTRAQSTPAAAPQGEKAASRISVNSNLVDLPVKVTDRQGRFVSDLKKENFRVYEDGRVQEITLFENGDIPATVGLVVDHSGSMLAKLPEVSAAAIAFARSSNPQDEMFVVNFNDFVSLELPANIPFTSDVHMLEKAVSNVTARGRTALNDAISAALDQLQWAHHERQALIIVSDGGDNASKHTFAQVLAQAQRSKAVIYSIGILDVDDNREQNPGALKKLAKATGGEAFFPGSAKEVASICQQVARDIRQQYTLGYAPASAGARDVYRKIEVQVVAPSHEKLRVRTRAGYIVPAMSAPPLPAKSGGL
jgi:Ca-activated chloride channel family protein